jgi:hypothetical protein
MIKTPLRFFEMNEEFFLPDPAKFCHAKLRRTDVPVHSLPFYTIGFMRFRSSKHPQIEAAKGFHDI